MRSSGILDVEDCEVAVHQAAVLWLQAVGDALFYLLAASLKPAAVTSQLLPGATPVLLLLATVGEELLHVVRESNLTGRETSQNCCRGISSHTHTYESMLMQLMMTPHPHHGDTLMDELLLFISISVPDYLNTKH